MERSNALNSQLKSIEKRLFLSEGIEAKTPREPLKEAYQGWDGF
jgi:hypothetical protein